MLVLKYLYMQGWISEMKSGSPFFGNRVANTKHFGKVIRNCEPLFAII